MFLIIPKWKNICEEAILNLEIIMQNLNHKCTIIFSLIKFHKKIKLILRN